jgi:hypothetical protein
VIFKFTLKIEYGGECMSLSKFKDFLSEHKVEPPQIEATMKLMSDFKEFLDLKKRGMENCNYEDMKEFSSSLIHFLYLCTFFSFLFSLLYNFS